MKMSELSGKSRIELNKALTSQLMAKFQLRMRKSEGEAAPKPHEFGRVRRTVARIKTVLNQLEMKGE